MQRSGKDRNEDMHAWLPIVVGIIPLVAFASALILILFERRCR